MAEFHCCRRWWLCFFSFPSCTRMQSTEFEQIFVGFNGPTAAGNFCYRDRVSLENSWVRRSLSDGEFDRLISKIDFKNQVVLAFAVGERQRASGVVTINRIRRFNGEKSSPMDVSVLVGVVDGACQQRDSASYPFALAVFKTPENFEPYGGFDVVNFPDGCKTPKAGSPVQPIRD